MTKPTDEELDGFIEGYLSDGKTLGRNGTSILQFISLSIVCILGVIICGTIFTDLKMKKE